MKIKKYVGRELMLFLMLVILIISLIFIYIKNNDSEETGSSVEKNMKKQVNQPELPQTTEENDNRVQIQIGKDKLLVNSYYYTENRVITSGSRNIIKEEWRASKPKKEYTIGVLLPHFEDKFWITANYGIINYAKELGVKVKLYSAGGYIEFGNQKEQLKALGKDDEIDGIIFAALDSTKFNSDISDIVNYKKPIVELINNVNSPKISAKAMVSFYEMGYKAGEYVINKAGGKDIKVAIFPGPKESGWAPDSFYGFSDAVLNLKDRNQKVAISTPFYGDTRPSVQRLHIVSVLEKNSDYDYLIGCAPAAIEAGKIIEENKEKFKNVNIVSTYINNEVYNMIQKGTILASPSDQTIQECRIALDMTVKILNGEKPGIDFPFQSGPEIPIISQENISQVKYEELFGTKDYKPILNNIDK